MPSPQHSDSTSSLAQAIASAIPLNYQMNPEKRPLRLKTGNTLNLTKLQDIMTETKIKNDLSMTIENFENEISNIQDLKDIGSILQKIENIEELAEIDGKNFELLNRRGEIGLRLARRAGEILANSPKNKGGRKSSDSSKERIPTYKDLGICPMRASRWQKIYAIPLTIFEQLLAKRKIEGEQITEAYFLTVHADLFPSANVSEKADSSANSGIDGSGEKDILETELEEKHRKRCPYCRQAMPRVRVLASNNTEKVAA